LNPDRPGFCDIATYLKLPREPETWLVKPLIPTGGAALLYGEAKLGKSYLAAQLAAAIAGQYDEWLGFPINQHGVVLYLQLDTPRSVWAHRFNELCHRGSIDLSNPNFKLADRDSIEHYPFDILQPDHMKYLHAIVQAHMPVTTVIIDTLREAHTGEENSSTDTRNVLVNITAACHPAAVILVSHARKPHPEIERDIMNDHRGSDQVVARMDAIMRLTKTRLYYAGRSIEQDNIRLERLDSGFWRPVVSDDEKRIMDDIMISPFHQTMREKARAIAPKLAITEEAAMSRLRRLMSKQKQRVTQLEVQLAQ